MKLNTITVTLMISMLGIGLAFSEESQINKPISTKCVEFPWELVTEKGKVYGCIYKNEFYSVGSIIVAEKLPVKCKISPARDGYWSELDDGELQLYSQSVKEQERLAAESLKVGEEAINHFEAAVIRSIRRAK